MAVFWDVAMCDPIYNDDLTVSIIKVILRNVGQQLPGYQIWRCYTSKDSHNREMNLVRPDNI
jgi:hypothetical protein